MISIKARLQLKIHKVDFPSHLLYFYIQAFYILSYSFTYYTYKSLKKFTCYKFCKHLILKNLPKLSLKLPKLSVHKITIASNNIPYFQ